MNPINKESFVPYVLLDNPDYNVFLDLIMNISNDIRNIISVLPEIVDVDNAPELFLPKLSALVDYQYRYDIDTDFMREVIKRVIEIYKQRGTSDEIIMAATYGDYKNWIGSHLFTPYSDKSRPKASIEYPFEQIFINNKSKLSGKDKIQGPYVWRSGVVCIKLPKLNDKIIEAIKKVIPAGLKIIYIMSSELIVDPDYEDCYGHIKGTVSYGAWTISTYNEISMDLIPSTMNRKILRLNDSETPVSSWSVISGKKSRLVGFMVESDSKFLPSDNSYTIENYDDVNCRVGRSKYKTPNLLVDIDYADEEDVDMTTVAEIYDEVRSIVKRELDSELQDLKDKNLELESKVSNLEKLNETLTQEHATDVADIRSDSDSIKERVSVVQTYATDLSDKHKNDVSKINSAIDDANSHIEDNKNNIDKLNSRVDSAIEIHNKDIDELNTKVDLSVESHNKDIDELDSRIDANEILISDFLSEVSRLDNSDNNILSKLDLANSENSFNIESIKKSVASGLKYLELENFKNLDNINSEDASEIYSSDSHSLVKVDDSELIINSVPKDTNLNSSTSAWFYVDGLGSGNLKIELSRDNGTTFTEIKNDNLVDISSQPKGSSIVYKLTISGQYTLNNLAWGLL